MICNRCNKLMNPLDAELCWYCGEALCFECWDKYGHCGHKEADEINLRMRDAYKKEDKK